ncbi:MAG: restriction endonuclease subunit S [Spirochaetes bacterium]|jgi:type I restriction enzyme S subunit|nr:restriction endonuclease subunit S [Spirochaetota bacterium]
MDDDLMDIEEEPTLDAGEVIEAADLSARSIEELIGRIFEYKHRLMERLLSDGIGHARFKESPAGRIPDSWRVVPLQEALAGRKIVEGPASLPGAGDVAAVVPVIIPECVGSLRLLEKRCGAVAKDRAKKLAEFAVAGSDIVMAVKGEYAGASAIMPVFFPGGILGPGCVRISADPGVCEPFYLNNVLHSYFQSGVLYTLNAGSGEMAIDLELLRRLMIKLPPISEQKRIADILLALSGEIVAGEDALSRIRSIRANFIRAQDE